MKALPVLINLLKESFDKLEELQEDIEEITILSKQSEIIKEKQQLELGIK